MADVVDDVERKHFNLVSQVKRHQVPFSVQIPERVTPGSPPASIFTFSLITMRCSSLMEKEIIPWPKASTVISNVNSNRKGVSKERNGLSSNENTYENTITEMKKIMLK